MDYIHGVLKEFLPSGETDISKAQFPMAIVSKMIDINKNMSFESGQHKEREENVCRLLASGMSAEDVSVVLKLRLNDIEIIERFNDDKIKDYAKKLKARQKYRKSTKHK